MGTEVAISFSSLRSQLEYEKSNLFKVDENIKKIVQTSGRFGNDRFHSPGDYTRGGTRPGARHSYPDTSNSGKTDDGLGKRKHEAKTVFSRLSTRTADSDGEDGVVVKRMRMPSAVSREMPSRASVLQAQAGDEAARTRNRRMFGSLLGTLHKFKQEEITLQNKEEKKAQVERKIEEQARLEKERAQAQRKSLFAERDQRKARIKALEAKMARMGEFERWEAGQRHLTGFILTRAKPHLYWLPKVMTDKAQEKLDHSRKFHEKCMSKKRLELQEELERIEQRILGGRPHGTNHNNSHERTAIQAETPHGRKRDKFASDAHHQMDDSDHDDLVLDKETSETKLNSMDGSEKMETTQPEDVAEPPPPGTEDVLISITENETNGIQDNDNHPVSDATDRNDNENGPDSPKIGQYESEQNDPEQNELEPEHDVLEPEHDVLEPEHNLLEPEHNVLEDSEPMHDNLEHNELVDNEPEQQDPESSQ